MMAAERISAGLASHSMMLRVCRVTLPQKGGFDVAGVLPDRFIDRLREPAVRIVRQGVPKVAGWRQGPLNVDFRVSMMVRGMSASLTMLYQTAGPVQELVP